MINIQSQSQNDYIREWLPRRREYLDTIIEAEGRPDDTCVHCHMAEANWRCTGCLGQPVFCTGCCRERHRLAPFHRVEQWTGTHWAASWLINVGTNIQLGHGGQPCPCPGMWNQMVSVPNDDDDEWEDEDEMDIPPAGETSDGAPSDKALRVDAGAPVLPDGDDGQLLTIVDISGVHRLVVRPCRCPSNVDSDDIQLLKMGLFPASFKRIRTAFTLQVLDDYRRDNLVCNTTAYQYFKKTRRVTSPAFPHSVPVCPQIEQQSIFKLPTHRTGIVNSSGYTASTETLNIENGLGLAMSTGNRARASWQSFARLVLNQGSTLHQHGQPTMISRLIH